MNTQDFIDIAVICHCGSFRKAAAELGISQPTLSHRIERSEQTLGAALFERSPGQARPTALARFIADRAGTLQAESEALMLAIRRLLHGETGKVTLGFGPVPAHAFLTEALALIRQTLPGLAVDVFIGTPLQLAEWMDSGRIDFAVCAHDPKLFAPPMVTEELRRDPVVIAGLAAHPIFQQDVAEIGIRLFDFPLAFPTLDHHYRAAFQSLYGVDFLALEGALQCSDYDVLIRLAKTGEFLTAGPSLTFHRERADGTLATRFMDKRLVHRLDIVTRGDASTIPALRAVQDVVRRTAKDVPT